MRRSVVVRVRVVAVLTVMAVLAGPGVAVAGGHHGGRGRAVAVRYGPWAGETGTLYGARSSPYPTVVYVHGGGWVSGTIDRQDTTFAKDLAGSLGWPVLAIDYPTTAEGGVPAFDVEQQAVNDAVHYAAGLPGTDPSHIVLWGESAGGNLALLDAERDTGHAHPRVSAVVSVSGPTQMRDEWNVCDRVMPNRNFVTTYEGETPSEADDAGQPRYDVTSPAGQSVVGEPPIFQAIGTSDPIVPASQAEVMDTAARSVGAGSVLFELDGVTDHADDLEPDIITITGNTVERQAELFLFTHYATRNKKLEVGDPTDRH